MSGPGNPDGPTNVGSLVNDSIKVARDQQATIALDTYLGMWPDPLPARVTRMQRVNNAGTIGENALDAAHPDADGEFIPHQYIPRRPLNVTPYDKTIDVTVTIPAVYVGSPLG